MNIRLATVYGRGDLVREHIEQGVSPDEAYEENGETPLMIAARMGHRCLIGDLLDAGADPNATAGKGHSALFTATVGERRPDVVDALLEAGADPNVETANGWTPLRSAEHESNEQIAARLREAGATR
jgi:ankyrin repeat protein